ncbi:hypothetical protein NC653_002443 [Populus alba x Populus x berolinensis]|uniref:Uncharacterized protein n=2 Tax=Populus alba x Populus x berolinensis TaxID=444605 RepID=A0AAD6RNQ9_9ROSI|nr:hypothetical protein NC653_002443 [Populus alba x Populus x berolinensis]
MAGEEGAAFSAGRKIFRYYYVVDEDSIAVAGKGRLLLISAGTMKTPLLPLHGNDHALLLLLRGVVVLSSDCGEGGLLVQGLTRRAGTVHGCHAAPSTVAPSVVILFMAETGDHDGAAKDFVDVALVHHAGAELLLEDDLSLMSLLRAGADG